MTRALRHEWHSLLYDPDVGLSTAAKVVGGALIEHANGNGRAWPSVPRLCDCTGLSSDNTVRKGLRELERRGLLAVERRTGRVNGYQLVLPELTPARRAGVPPHEPTQSPAQSPTHDVRANHRTREPGNQGRAIARRSPAVTSESVIARAAELDAAEGNGS